MNTKRLANLLLLAAMLMPAATKAQTLVDNYRFFTNVATTEWIDIDGIDSVIIAPTETVNSIASNRIATGFTFMLADTAAVGGHWQFLGWNDGGTGNPRDILVTFDTAIVALFEWVADSTEGIFEVESGNLS